jgi:hypothetical protein
MDTRNRYPTGCALDVISLEAKIIKEPHRVKKQRSGPPRVIHNPKDVTGTILSPFSIRQPQVFERTQTKKMVRAGQRKKEESVQTAAT